MQELTGMRKAGSASSGRQEELQQHNLQARSKNDLFQKTKHLRQGHITDEDMETTVHRIWHNRDECLEQGRASPSPQDQVQGLASCPKVLLQWSHPSVCLCVLVCL